MVHPKVNTTGSAKSASHPQISTGATTVEPVAEATRSAGKCAQPSKCSTEHSRRDGIVAEATQATRVSERKRDRQTLLDAGNDYHARHHRAACHRFHAGLHLAARRLHGGCQLHGVGHDFVPAATADAHTPPIWPLCLPPRLGPRPSLRRGHPSIQHRNE